MICPKSECSNAFRLDFRRFSLFEAINYRTEVYCPKSEHVRISDFDCILLSSDPIPLRGKEKYFKNITKVLYYGRGDLFGFQTGEV